MFVGFLYKLVFEKNSFFMLLEKMNFRNTVVFNRAARIWELKTV